MENFRLRVFRTVAQRLSFRAAAEDLLLTQPAVTQQIKALEFELNAPLFDRSGGRISLTPAGLALLPFAEQLAQLAGRAEEAVAATAGLVAGQLAIGASQTIGQYLLPRLLAGFLQQHPRAQVIITGGNTQTVLDELRAHRIQLALIEGPALGNDVRVKPFLRDRLVCVVPGDHPWASQEVSLEDLRHATVLTREQGSGSRRVLERALEEAGITPRDLPPGITFDSTEALLGAVEAGLGLAFVSPWAVRHQLALGTLALARVQGLRLARMFTLATPSGPEPSGVAGAFYHFVLDRAPQLAPHFDHPTRLRSRSTPGRSPEEKPSPR